MLSKFRKKNGDNTTFYTGSVILLFNKTVEIDIIEIDGVDIKINRMKPKPMLCLHCGLIGHTIRFCKRINDQLCRTCLLVHSIDEVCIVKCRNCNENHSSFYSGCGAVKMEEKILNIKEIHNVSHTDAKTILLKSKLNSMEHIFGENKLDSNKKFEKLLEENIMLMEKLDCIKIERDRAIERVEILENDVIPKLQAECNYYRTEGEKEAVKRIEIKNKEKEDKFMNMLITKRLWKFKHCAWV